jgi:hypothetical protein
MLIVQPVFWQLPDEELAGEEAGELEEAAAPEVSTDSLGEEPGEAPVDTMQYFEAPSQKPDRH